MILLFLTNKLNRMKQMLLFFLIITSLSLSTVAQTNIPPLDKSPMDMCHYPANYPVLKVQNKATEPLVARVIYSRPQKNGRTVYGELVEYGKVWRMGANEATEIELYKDVKIGFTKVKRGRYSVYAIPHPDKWTIILNKETDIWGAFQYDQKKDILRTDIPIVKQQGSVETFSMEFEKINGGANLVVLWDDVKASIPFTFERN
jgi:hypothetical protein